MVDNLHRDNYARNALVVDKKAIHVFTFVKTELV